MLKGTPLRDGNKRFTVVRDAEEFGVAADNIIFEAPHHVGEIILGVRRVSGRAA
jgi:hypothetical protein